jgi:hypothetical protein
MTNITWSEVVFLFVVCSFATLWVFLIVKYLEGPKEKQ